MRRANDPSHKRGNFEKHLKFIEPQSRYFKYITSINPDFVSFIEARSILANVKNIKNDLATIQIMSLEEQLELFDRIIDWLKKNQAS